MELREHFNLKEGIVLSWYSKAMICCSKQVSNIFKYCLLAYCSKSLKWALLSPVGQYVKYWSNAMICTGTK